MINYIEPKEIDFNQSNELCDVLFDVGHDLHGLALNLQAIADQPSAIEPEQVRMLSDVAHYIDGAIAGVLEHLRGEAV